jgi:hypothetical protein
MNEEQQNDIQTPNYEGEKMKMPENSDHMRPEGDSKPGVISGPMLAILIFLLLIILGGMYYWLSIMNQAEPMSTPTVERPTTEENNEPESTTAEAQVEATEAVSTSDEIEAIEADLEATDLESLDAELEAIDAELEAALEGL